MKLQHTPLFHRPRLTILNSEQIREIHSATLEVLERIGVKITHPKALDYLDGAGAQIVGDRVRMPSFMVERAIATAPKRLILGNRRGERAVVVEGQRTWFGPSLDCIDYMDPLSGERTRFTSDHCRITAGLADTLENYSWVMTIGMAHDQPPERADRVIARQALQYCEKPLVFCCNDTASVEAIHEMAVAVCGDAERFAQAPIVVHYSEPISPLVYYDPAIDKIMYCAEHGIPLINFPAPQLGGSAPASFAGTIVQAGAESLSGLVLAQAVRPGAPFVYGAFATIMDMQTTVFSYGAPELSLMCGAMAQMAQHYGLPFYGTGGATDAKFCDAQAGMEAAFQTLSQAAVGAGLVHDCSSWMDHGSLVSPAYMVMVNELLARVNQFMNGVDVTRETLAVEVIERVGPGGHYLDDPFTLANFDTVHYSPLFDRQIHDTWKEQGAKRFEERLAEMTQKALARTPAPLPDEVIRELDRMQNTWG